MPAAPRQRFWPFIIDNYVLLIVGTAAALLWANVHVTSYQRIAHALSFAVNDVGMALFFALAAKEIIEARLPGGALESPAEAAVPLLAAVGGMAVPAALYAVQAMLAGRPELRPGWAIPCATDIAFSYMVARFIFSKDHPAIPFLLVLAVVDDALGLILLAAFYPTGPVSLVALLVLMIPALATAYWLHLGRIRSFWAYTLISGSLSWAALFLGGFHPALALVPIMAFMPHERRDLRFFVPEQHGSPDTLVRFGHWWRVPVQVILFFFGLTNAGVEISTVGTATWMVLSALLIGKPLGIVLMTLLAGVAGLRAPAGLSYRDIAVVGVAAGIGFTVALFFATAAFPAGSILDEAKMGALLSFAAAPLAVGLARALRQDPRRAGPSHLST